MNDSHAPITLSFSDGSTGECELRNKRETYLAVLIPSTHSVRRSDDALVFSCETSDGRKAVGRISSDIDISIGGNVFFGGGIGAIIDANTDKHREYPNAYIIQVPPKT